MTVLWLLATTQILIGLCGLILRRNLFFIAFNSMSVFLGTILLSVNVGPLDLFSSDTFATIILLFLFCIHWILLMGVLIFLYRSRGIVYLDVLRDLRG